MEMKPMIVLFYFLQTVAFISGYHYEYIGCFKDKKSPNRALPESHKSLFGNSVDYCVRKCGDEGYRYFALAQSYQCWCGNSGYDRYGPSTSCFYPCSGNVVQLCGGRHRNSVYEIVYSSPPASSTVAAATSSSTNTASATNRPTAATPMTTASLTKISNIPSLSITIPTPVTRSTSNVTISLTPPSPTSTTLVLPKHLPRSDSSPWRVYPTTPAGSTTKFVTSANAAGTTSPPTTTTFTTMKPTAAIPIHSATPIETPNIPSLNTTTSRTVSRSISNVTVPIIPSPATTASVISKDTSTSDLLALKSSAPGNGKSLAVSINLKSSEVYIGIGVGVVAGCAIFVLVVVLVARRCSRQVARRDCPWEVEELQASPSHIRGCAKPVIPAAARAGALRYDNGVYNACSYSIRPQKAKHAIYSQAECTVLTTSMDV